MAYHGYIPIIKKFMDAIDTPRILEIGIDTGATAYPIIFSLMLKDKSFEFIGIDVRIQPAIKIVMSNLDLVTGQNIYLYEDSSLNILPKMVEEGQKFNVILLDGDHNYHTVSNELKHMESLLAQSGLLIIDDYQNRWAHQDLWYGEQPGYEEVKFATKRVMTEKQGVAPAVDDFLASNPNWTAAILLNGEPIVLARKDEVNFVKI